MEWIVWGALLASAGVAGWFGFVIYRLYVLRWRVSRALGDLDRQLRRRHGLIPALVEAVSRRAGGGGAAVAAVIQARNAAISAQGLNQQAASEGVLQDALGRLVARGQDIQVLKGAADVQALKDELVRIEAGIAAARRVFNTAVAAHNEAIGTRSAALVAGPLSYRPLAFFDVGETQRQALEAAPSPHF